MRVSGLATLCVLPWGTNSLNHKPITLSRETSETFPIPQRGDTRPNRQRFLAAYGSVRGAPRAYCGLQRLSTPFSPFQSVTVLPNVFQPLSMSFSPFQPISTHPVPTPSSPKPRYLGGRALGLTQIGGCKFLGSLCGLTNHCVVLAAGVRYTSLWRTLA